MSMPVVMVGHGGDTLGYADFLGIGLLTLPCARHPCLAARNGLNLTKETILMPNSIIPNAVKDVLRQINGAALHVAHRVEKLIENISVVNDTMLFLSKELDKSIGNVSVLITEIEKEIMKVNFDPENHQYKRRKTDK